MIVISSNPLRTTYPKKSLASITVHVVSKVLCFPLGLVEIRVSWPGHLQKKKKKKKKKKKTLKGVYVGYRLEEFFLIQ